MQHPSRKPIDTSSPNFQKWKRLHICVSKLESVTEMTSHMSFFAVVSLINYNYIICHTYKPINFCFGYLYNFIVGSCRFKN